MLPESVIKKKESALEMKKSSDSEVNGKGKKGDME